MKLRYERRALADLDEIFGYIANDNPEAAARLVARIEQVVIRLVQSPYIARQRATRDGDFPWETI